MWMGTHLTVSAGLWGLAMRACPADGDRAACIPADAAKNLNSFNALKNNERHIPSALKPPVC